MDWMDCTSSGPFYDDTTQFDYLATGLYEEPDTTVVVPNDFDQFSSCMTLPGLSPASEESSNGQNTSSITSYEDTLGKDSVCTTHTGW